MSFPIEDKELKAAYWHLRNFGQVAHADAIIDFAERFKIMEDQLNDLKQHLKQNKKEASVNYEEYRRKDLERRSRFRIAPNE